MPTPAPAPWVPLFLSHLSHLKPPTFSLATTTPSASTPPTNPSFPPHAHTLHTFPHPPTPRVRTLIHRGLLLSLPPNPHNTLTPPPTPHTSSCLTFTTDSRSTKTGEFLPSPATTSGGDATRGTTGGAVTECCFWIPETNNQWRIRGRTYLLAEADIEDPASEPIRRLLEAEFNDAPDRAGEGVWTWRKEVLGHWGNLAPEMRGSFANPPPGVGLDVDLREWKEKMGVREVEKGRVVADAEVRSEEGWQREARRNFRVGVVVPEVVERVDLVEDGGRRWVWWREGEGRVWREKEVWP